MQNCLGFQLRERLRALIAISTSWFRELGLVMVYDISYGCVSMFSGEVEKKKRYTVTGVYSSTIFFLILD